MDAAKLNQLKAIQSSLEDLHNSQVALVQKVAQLEVNLMNAPDKEVEEDLVEVYTNASDTEDLVKNMLEKFNKRVDQANKAYTPGPEEAAEK